jgi:hypothetical protein
MGEVLAALPGSTVIFEEKVGDTPMVFMKYHREGKGTSS